MACTFFLTSWDTSSRESAHEFAEVGSSRVTEPAPDLFLSEEGKRKGSALSVYFRGLMFQESLEIPEAIKCFKESLGYDPSNVDLAMETANLCAAYGEFDEAIALLEENLKQNPLNPDAWLHISQYCETYGSGDDAMKERAVDQAAKTFERFPHEADVIRHYTGLLMTRSEKDEARKVLEQTLRLPSKDPMFWLSIGSIAKGVWSAGPGASEEERGKINEIYEKVLKLAEGDRALSERVADHYSKTQQFSEAERVYREIIERFPESLRTREKLVRVYRLNKKPDDALKALLELVQINPHRAKTQELLSDMYKDLGNMEKAIEHFRELMKIRPGDEQDYIDLADMLEKEERWEEVVEVLEQAIRLHPDSVAITGALAVAYINLKKPEKALDQYAALEKIAEANEEPLTEQFYYWYGAAAEQAKKPERAAELFRKSIELVNESGEHENAAKSLNHLGYMWLELDRNIDEAGELIRRANELKPDTPAYIDSLGWFHFKKKEYAKALDLLLKAAEGLDEPDPVVFDHVAQAYFQMEEHAKAVEYIKKAVDLDGENEAYKKQLGEYKAAAEAAGKDAAEEKATDEAA